MNKGSVSVATCKMQGTPATTFLYMANHNRSKLTYICILSLLTDTTTCLPLSSATHHINQLWINLQHLHMNIPSAQGKIMARVYRNLKDNCCVQTVEKERIISVKQQGPMEGATSEDLKGNLSKQVTIGVVTDADRDLFRQVAFRVFGCSSFHRALLCLHLLSFPSHIGILIVYHLAG